MPGAGRAGPRRLDFDRRRVTMGGGDDVHRAGKVEMARRFEGHAIRFSYPTDWSVEVADDDEGVTTVSLGAPDGVAFAVVRADASRPEPGEVLDDALGALRAEYPTLRAEAVTEEIDGCPAEGFDVEFFQFDAANSATLRCFRTGDRTVFFLGQWSELEEGDPGAALAAVRRSLRGSTGA